MTRYALVAGASALVIGAGAWLVLHGSPQRAGVAIPEADGQRAGEGFVELREAVPEPCVVLPQFARSPAVAPEAEPASPAVAEFDASLVVREPGWRVRLLGADGRAARGGWAEPAPLGAPLDLASPRRPTSYSSFLVMPELADESGHVALPAHPSGALRALVGAEGHRSQVVTLAEPLSTVRLERGRTLAVTIEHARLPSWATLTRVALDNGARYLGAWGAVDGEGRAELVLEAEGTALVQGRFEFVGELGESGWRDVRLAPRVGGEWIDTRMLADGAVLEVEIGPATVRALEEARSGARPR